MGQRKSTLDDNRKPEVIDLEHLVRYPHHFPFVVRFPPHYRGLQPFDPAISTAYTSQFPAASACDTPAVQNVPEKADICKPCADDGQKREGTEKVATNRKIGGKESPIPKKDANTLKAANTLKQRSPTVNFGKKTTVDQQPQIQKTEKPEIYVPTGRPEMYVPTGRPEMLVPTGRPEMYVPSGIPETYLPSGRKEMYFPSEKLERYYSSESESSDSDTDEDDDSDDDNDDDDDDYDYDDDNRHKNIVRKVIIFAAAPCYPVSSVEGRSLPSKKINMRRLRVMPAQMAPYHCPVSSHFYQQRFNGWNQGTTCPGGHRFPTNYDSSFVTPNTYLTPVLCPSSNLNFGSDNTRTHVLDTGQKNLAIDADGFCETIKSLADILGPDDNKILEEVMEQFTSGNLNNSRKNDCRGKYNQRE